MVSRVPTPMNGISFGAPPHASHTNTKAWMSTKKSITSLSLTKSHAKIDSASTSSECKNDLARVHLIFRQTPTFFPMSLVTFTITTRNSSSTRARRMSGSWNLQIPAKEEVSILSMILTMSMSMKLVSSASTLPTHCWLTVTSSICASMCSLPVTNLWKSMSIRRV